MVIYASCNTEGLISTFAGLALLFCIKLNALAQRAVPRRKTVKYIFNSDTFIISGIQKCLDF